MIIFFYFYCCHLTNKVAYNNHTYHMQIKCIQYFILICFIFFSYGFKSRSKVIIMSYVPTAHVWGWNCDMGIKWILNKKTLRHQWLFQSLNHEQRKNQNVCKTFISSCLPIELHLTTSGSVALLVARRTNDRKVAGSRPTKVVCISVDRLPHGGELPAVAGRHSFFRAVGSWSLDCQCWWTRIWHG